MLTEALAEGARSTDAGPPRLLRRTTRRRSTRTRVSATSSSPDKAKADDARGARIAPEVRTSRPLAAHASRSTPRDADGGSAAQGGDLGCARPGRLRPRVRGGGQGAGRRSGRASRCRRSSASTSSRSPPGRPPTSRSRRRCSSSWQQQVQEAEPGQAQHVAPGRGQEGHDQGQPALRHVLQEPQRLRGRPPEGKLAKPAPRRPPARSPSGAWPQRPERHGARGAGRRRRPRARGPRPADRRRRSPPSSGCRSGSCAPCAIPRRSVVAGATSFDDVYDSSASFDEVYAAHRRARSSTPPPPTARCSTPCRARRSVAERTRRAAARPTTGSTSRSCPRCRSSTSRGPGSASTRSPTACASSTVVASRSRPRGSGARCSSRSATRAPVLSDIKLAVDGTPGPDVTVLQRLGLPDESVRDGGVGRPRPGGRARPPHVVVDARARGAGRQPSWSASPSWCARCGSAARGTVSRPTSRSPATCSRRPTRCSRPSRGFPRSDRAPRGGARRPAVPGGLPRHPRRRGGRVHARRRGPRRSTTSSSAATPTCSRDVDGRHARTWSCGTGSRSSRPRRAGESLMDGIPGDLPSLLYAHKVQRKAASVGFDWDSPAGVYPKVAEELREVEDDPGDEELGDLLFAAVEPRPPPRASTRRRRCGCATAKFRDRFRVMEATAAERGDRARRARPDRARRVCGTRRRATSPRSSDEDVAVGRPCAARARHRARTGSSARTRSGRSPTRRIPGVPTRG